jgi:hypothetical protein
MRTSILGAAFLLAGTGAATLAAAVVDTNGNGLSLNGSDTLFDVTNAIIGSCGTQFTANGDSMSAYSGGGSGVGAGRMVGSGGVGTQAVSPMSAALSSGQYCLSSPSSIYASPAAASSPTLTEGLLVGIDGVAIVADQNNSCSQVGDGLGGTTAENGFGLGTAMTVNLTAGGTSSYTFGDPAGLYPNQPSFDALAVLYFGLTHDGTYNCSSDTRKSLIASWGNLFTTPCAAGGTACGSGLSHAWRRSDLSGTTDAFIKVLNPPNGSATNGKGAGVTVGIGSLATVTGAGSGPKSNPFCNSADAQVPAPGPATVSAGGSSDYQDLDKFRTACGANGVNESVCEGWKNFATGGGATQGDLGVVLPILIPDSTVTTQTDSFPTQTCTSQCALVAVMKSANVPPGYKCPNGGNPVLGGCWMPAVATATNPDPRCISTFDLKCVGGAGKPDGRAFNLVTVVPRTQVAAVQNSNPAVFANIGNKPYQFAEDQNARLIDRSYYRMHVSQSLNPDLTVSGATGLCAENDDTSQIGCLTNADPCSIGYAGREAAKGYPGGSPQVAKALKVNGTAPFTPLGTATCTANTNLAPGVACDNTNGVVVASNTDADFGLKSLLSPRGSTPLYPFARRLYFNTIYGFGNLQGAEKDLSECYATNSFVNSALTAHGFVPNPSGVQCIDYPEQLTTNSTPAPNVQGSGNVALGGCAGSGTGGINACQAFQLKDVNGTNVPEATETF